jgi:hypothetical protein
MNTPILVGMHHRMLTLGKFNVGPALVQLDFLHMPNPHRLGWGCGKLNPIQQRQEYRRKLLFVSMRRRHNCLPELSGRPSRVRGAVVVACVWTPEDREDTQIKARDARDSVDEQSCAPRTRVHPSLPLYLAPLGLAARCIFWG